MFTLQSTDIRLPDASSCAESVNTPSELTNSLAKSNVSRYTDSNESCERQKFHGVS